MAGNTSKTEFDTGLRLDSFQPAQTAGFELPLVLIAEDAPDYKMSEEACLKALYAIKDTYTNGVPSSNISYEISKKILAFRRKISESFKNSMVLKNLHRTYSGVDAASVDFMTGIFNASKMDVNAFVALRDFRKAFMTLSRFLSSSTVFNPQKIEISNFLNSSKNMYKALVDSLLDELDELDEECNLHQDYKKISQDVRAELNRNKDFYFSLPMLSQAQSFAHTKSLDALISALKADVLAFHRLRSDFSAQNSFFKRVDELK